jgi:hypothetical protein
MDRGRLFGADGPCTRELPEMDDNPRKSKTSNPPGSDVLLNVAVIPLTVFEKVVVVPTASDSKVKSESARAIPTAAKNNARRRIPLEILEMVTRTPCAFEGTARKPWRHSNSGGGNIQPVERANSGREPKRLLHSTSRFPVKLHTFWNL